jgi:hypothetical protein
MTFAVFAQKNLIAQRTWQAAEELGLRIRASYQDIALAMSQDPRHQPPL